MRRVMPLHDEASTPAQAGVQLRAALESFGSLIARTHPCPSLEREEM